MISPHPPQLADAGRSARPPAGPGAGGFPQSGGGLGGQVNDVPAHQMMAGNAHIHAQKKRFRPKKVKTRK